MMIHFQIQIKIYLNIIQKIYFIKIEYLLDYPKGNEVGYSISKINSLKEDNYTIYHINNSISGLLGCPLININNY